MQESQLDLSTTERQLLYDIRTEQRKTNELLTQLLDVLRPIARDTVRAEESKEDNINGALPISGRSNSGGNSSRNGTSNSSKRKALPNKQHRSSTTVLSPNDDSNGGKRVSGSGRSANANKVHGEKQFISDL